MSIAKFAYGVAVLAALILLPLPTQAKVIAKKLPVKRGPASFTQGFKVTKSSCDVYKEPLRVQSKRLATVEAGRRIWLTAMDSEWLMAVTKRTARTVYIHKNCLN